ncbi:Cytoskeleton-associated protein 4 [Heterocephalus glaber]|uniref:Cytoskeleton-associated protein 4 n=1 Tax=Heterocephalus glaber TaxID=10181 RepID=G5ATA3_HETGA|nr:Cytoskeleton-associated protein 4 [Heterocephalus glaber]
MFGMEQKVQLLQATFGILESDLRNSQHKRFHRETREVRGALTEKLQCSEKSALHLPNEVRRSWPAQGQGPWAGGDEVWTQGTLDWLLQKGWALDFRLQGVESGVHTLQEAFASLAESLLSLISRSMRPAGLGPEVDRDSLASTVQSLGEAQLDALWQPGELKRNTRACAHTTQGGPGHLATKPRPTQQAVFTGRLQGLSEPGGVRLMTLRSAVDSLFVYLVKIERKEHTLESSKDLLDLRRNLDRLFLKVEKIYEKDLSELCGQERIYSLVFHDQKIVFPPTCAPSTSGPPGEQQLLGLQFHAWLTYSQ